MTTKSGRVPAFPPAVPPLPPPRPPTGVPHASPLAAARPVKAKTDDTSETTLPRRVDRHGLAPFVRAAAVARRHPLRTLPACTWYLPVVEAGFGGDQESVEEDGGQSVFIVYHRPPVSVHVRVVLGRLHRLQRPRLCPIRRHPTARSRPCCPAPDPAPPAPPAPRPAPGTLSTPFHHRIYAVDELPNIHAVVLRTRILRLVVYCFLQRHHIGIRQNTTDVLHLRCPTRRRPLHLGQDLITVISERVKRYPRWNVR